MLKRMFMLSLSGAFCLGLLAAPTFAQDKDAAGEAPSEADMKAMMDAYVKAAEPGEHHKHLNYFVGTWKLSVKNLMSGTEDTGTSTCKWILGNRYVICDVESSMYGMPFQGHGMTAYDKGLKKYTNIWCDNMSTGFMISYGTCDASGKNWTYEGGYVDPMSGEKTATKETLKIINDDSFVWTLSGPGPDGQEMAMMEITYQRQ